MGMTAVPKTNVFQITYLSCSTPVGGGGGGGGADVKILIARPIFFGFEIWPNPVFLDWQMF